MHVTVRLVSEAYAANYFTSAVPAADDVPTGRKAYCGVELDRPFRRDGRRVSLILGLLAVVPCEALDGTLSLANPAVPALATPSRRLYIIVNKNKNQMVCKCARGLLRLL